jgi:hypothetical protein
MPEDAAIMEQLDTETGLTVARLGRPVELYRDTFIQQSAGRFAFLGPFETNQMGSRELFLWVALPVNPSAGAQPVIEADGVPLSLPAPAREAGSAGLTASPYRIPTPWSAMFYYKVDEGLLGRLGQASRLTIRVVEDIGDATANTVFSAEVPDSRLRDFAAR